MFSTLVARRSVRICTWKDCFSGPSVTGTVTSPTTVWSSAIARSRHDASVNCESRPTVMLATTRCSSRTFHALSCEVTDGVLWNSTAQARKPTPLTTSATTRTSATTWVVRRGLP